MLYITLEPPLQGLILQISECLPWRESFKEASEVTFETNLGLNVTSKFNLLIVASVHLWLRSKIRDHGSIFHVGWQD